jgi:hypothetical protein
MGREIRRVPPNWEHPRGDRGHGRGEDFLAMYDRDYESDARAWNLGIVLWELQRFSLLRWIVKHLLPKRIDRRQADDDYNYWEYCNPPDSETCRPKFTEEATWFQVYETVSEGTPVTPPFETKEELIEYLTAHGDFWDQRRRQEGGLCEHFDNEPWTEEAARSFVRAGSAPTFVGFPSKGLILKGPEGMVEMAKEDS